MSSSRRRYVAAFVVLTIAVCSVISYSALAQTKKPSATAQIMIVKRGDASDQQRQFQEDYMATQQTLLKSQLIAERAVTSGKLDQLPSFKDRNAVEMVKSSLVVTRDLEYKTPLQTVTLSIVDLPKADAIAVLDAVIGAYSNFITEVYADKSEQTIRTLNLARDEIETRIKDAEQKYDTFLKQVPIVLGGRLNSQAQQLHGQVKQRLSEIEVKMSEIEARLLILEKLAGQKEMADAVKLRVFEWASKAGLEQGQASVEGYLNMQRLERAELEGMRSSLEKLLKKPNDELREMLRWENDEERLRAERNRARALFDRVRQLIEDANLRKENPGLKIVVLSRSS